MNFVAFIIGLKKKKEKKNQNFASRVYTARLQCHTRLKEPLLMRNTENGWNHASIGAKRVLFLLLFLNMYTSAPHHVYGQARVHFSFSDLRIVRVNACRDWYFCFFNCHHLKNVLIHLGSHQVLLFMTLQKCFRSLEVSSAAVCTFFVVLRVGCRIRS